ncbi:hypothetical protein EVA_14197 [gut metagenome]|uniref:Uncharacterized protein n=1 Tax=gut metagenome TaxID=749906 RepID=J9FRX5_9ZZZZ
MRRRLQARAGRLLRLLQTCCIRPRQRLLLHHRRDQPR